MSDDERGEDGRSEAQIRMEQEQKRRKERAAEEMAEYEEMRREQREKEAEDIRQLRGRRETRRKEREEEEKRLAEQRTEDEKKRRAEEDERQRKKKEEEAKKREAREAKRKEYEEKTKKSGPNFTINKKASDGTEVAGETDEAAPEKKPTKSKEQLDAERKVEMEKRYHKVATSGLGADQLRDKAKELHQLIYHLESEKYDLMKRFEQQNYDMQELAERARQISKGGGKNKVNVNQVPDPLAAKFSGIPAKVVMYSQYERIKDHRSFNERSDVFSGPLYSEEYTRVEPTQKIVMTEIGARVVEGGDTGGAAATNGEA